MKSQLITTAAIALNLHAIEAASLLSGLTGGGNSGLGSSGSALGSSDSGLGSSGSGLGGSGSGGGADYLSGIEGIVNSIATPIVNGVMSILTGGGGGAASANQAQAKGQADNAQSEGVRTEVDANGHKIDTEQLFNATASAVAHALSKVPANVTAEYPIARRDDTADGEVPVDV